MSFGNRYYLESDDLTTVRASSDPCREGVDLGLALLNDGGLNLSFWYNISLAGVLERNDVATIRHDSVLDRGLTLPRVEWNDLVAVGLGGVLDWNVALGNVATLEGFNNAVLGLGWDLSRDVVDVCLTLLDDGHRADDLLHVSDDLLTAGGKSSLLERQGEGAGTDGDGGDGNSEDSDDLGEEHGCFFGLVFFVKRVERG